MTVTVMTLGFNEPYFVEDGLKHFQQHNDPNSYDRHVLVDPHYPGNKPGAIQAIAQRLGLEFVEIENRGCHGNWDWFLRTYCPNDDDILVGACPDSRGVDHEWVAAGVSVLRHDPKCYTVQLNRPIDYPAHGYRPVTEVVGGQNVLDFGGDLAAWSTGMFNAGLVREAGGFGARTKNYGYMEHYLVDKLAPKGYRWLFLKDHYDHGVGSPDPRYVQWKIDSAAFKTDLKFEDWLRSR